MGCSPDGAGHGGIGSIVRVRDRVSDEVFEYELVGRLEGDATTSRVSSAAPVGRALIGQCPGGGVVVATPRGPIALEVLQVAPRRSAGARKAA